MRHYSEPDFDSYNPAPEYDLGRDEFRCTQCRHIVDATMIDDDIAHHNLCSAKCANHFISALELKLTERRAV